MFGRFSKRLIPRSNLIPYHRGKFCTQLVGQSPLPLEEFHKLNAQIYNKIYTYVRLLRNSSTHDMCQCRQLK